jgi:hypothetical protein
MMGLRHLVLEIMQAAKDFQLAFAIGIRTALQIGAALVEGSPAAIRTWAW